MTDKELASTDPDDPWERYVLLETQTLQIFTRNLYNTNDSTFEITIQQSEDGGAARMFQQLIGLLLVLLCCCFGVSATSVLCRMRCGHKERVQDIAADGRNPRDPNGGDAARRGGRRQDQHPHAPPRMTREERAAARQKAHDTLLEKYAKLIPVLKYKKNIDVDEFKF